VSKVLRVDEQIYQSWFKGEGSGTYSGSYGDQPVIIKVGDERMAYEAEVLKAVPAESIPEYIMLREKTAGSFQLAMSRLAGVPLPEITKLESDWTSQVQPIEQAKRITLGLTAAFLALKEAGYLYRDLNLAHVLVAESSVGLCDHEADVRLEDGGCAIVDTRIGTWETMAPEEFEVGESMTEASSTYTLGVVMMQLVSGNSPFYVPNPDDLELDVLRESSRETHLILPRIDTNHHSLDDLLNKSLDPSPAKRFQTLSDFYEALSTLRA
jgi:serine/threonine protein kinase